jgi:DNA excision repair protein ERCC-4
MSGEPVIRIVADDRERAGGVISELRTLNDVAVDVARLGVGDYLVNDHIVVERKTLLDFAQSVIDARWFRQIGAMKVGERTGVIVLEGVGHQSLPVSREALQGALITATVFYGIPILRARDSAETARLLVYLGRQAQRFSTGAIPRPGYRPKGKRARQLFILQGLPGIGPERAADLLTHFGSVEAVFRASAEDLANVRRIGPNTAGKIRSILDCSEVSKP